MINVKLVFRNGDCRGDRVPVSGTPFLIGRHVACDLRLQGEHVSRRHALLSHDANGILIQDLRSREGTIVNRRTLEVGEKYRCCHRDKIQIGKWKFHISVRDARTNEPIVDPSIDIDTDTESSLEDWTGFLIRELDALTEELRIRNDPTCDSAARSLTTEFHGEVTRPSHPNPSQNERPAEDLNVVNAASAPDRAAAEDAPPPESLETVSKAKEGPQRLPAHLHPKGPSDSKDAAQQALRRHFRM